MKRTTIMLPEELKLKAEKRANKIGVSLGGFIRLSLEAQLKQRKNISYKDSLFEDNTVFDGNVPDDISVNHDKYLYGD